MYNELAASSAIKSQVTYLNAGDATKSAFNQAISAAQAVLSNKSATQADVDSALSALQTARSALDGKATDTSA
ncbi:hypothetical protein [Lactobacillus pasteurii]|uniref:hypothetical protein n=1 Tax=Lactobacillus pasteurii TaxID=872327 RepID=UPI003B8A7E63